VTVLGLEEFHRVIMYDGSDEDEIFLPAYKGYSSAGILNAFCLRAVGGV